MRKVGINPGHEKKIRDTLIYPEEKNSLTYTLP
jgi:hypothetical protein